MSEADQFRQYADEALLWAAQSKTEKEKEALIDLARTWMQATLESLSSSTAVRLRPGLRKADLVGGLVRRAAWTRRHFL